ncbi:MAG: glycine reductase [Rhizobiales bacterium]|nr:glycine reductase [Hyphomicrobiales bacterium]
MARTRAYYLALGYDNPYRWAHHVDAPFAPLSKPLAQTRLALVVTAAPFQEGKGDQGPGAPYNAAAKFYEVYSRPSDADADLRISHIAYDRAHNRADDPSCWFPLPPMRRLAAEGRFRLAARIHGLPTNRSRQRTEEVDAPDLVARLREDGAQAAIFVPNCPVCHQSVSLAARAAEAAGIATVVMGCAKDIVEHAGAPRFLFSDFPLGHAAGKPHDSASQAATLDLALRLLESAPGPRTSLHSPQRWAADGAWKADYMNVERMSAAEVARRRAEFDRQKALAAGLRETLR